MEWLRAGERLKTARLIELNRQTAVLQPGNRKECQSTVTPFARTPAQVRSADGHVDTLSILTLYFLNNNRKLNFSFPV